MGGDGNGDHYFEYDALSRLTKYRDFDDDPNGTRQTMAYGYDAAGNVTSMTDYEGGVWSYAYTDTNRLWTMTGPSVPR
jgi:YD repeat-containing protein